jgi:diguanylate cyclase (GGDEF)-like protein
MSTRAAPKSPARKRAPRVAAPHAAAPRTTAPRTNASETGKGPAPASSEPAPLVGVKPPATDVLIFRVSPTTFSLVGGSGRGAGWMGIVDLPRSGEPVASRVVRSSKPTHVDRPGEPVRIIGPYWAAHAFLVPVGGEHLVVFGCSQQLTEPDATLVPAATRLVAELEQVPPDKLLADELEVVQAIRDMMDSHGTTTAEVARHVAARAADPLSCEVGAVLVRANGRVIAEVVTRDWPTVLDADQIRDTLIRLFDRVEGGALLEQELEAAADDALGRNQGLVARFAVPIGRSEPFGVLVVAHAASRPRGFTNLCQRIGHALADAAEPLLLQASSRDALTLERDRLAIEARTDRLTGLENRTSWDGRIQEESERRGRYPEVVSIVSADLNGLKAINDRLGHEAGDRAIKAAADLLRRTARSTDHVARVGGDEFLILMPETDEAGAERFMNRVMIGALQTLCDGACLSISLGAATAAADESLVDTVRRADARMYASKIAAPR